MPPPAEGFAPRLIIRPALRSQSDRRLVTLVREGYEVAFEEIVRRYGRPLGRYAATIVGGRSEDVTQDAFSKALLALRRTDAEIELRPWLYRIVRNTALNDLRDRLPVSELADTLPASGGPAEQVEQREELLELTRRLQALPDPQRAAIVMRELEGLGHDEIAAALGLSGGGARQAIYRARATLRDGLGMLVPLPLIKALLSEDLTRHAEIATGAIGSAGTGVTLKATAATLLVAGTVGAGVVLHGDPGSTEPAATARAATTRHAGSGPAGQQAGQSLREGHGSATSSQAGRRGSEGHGAGHAASGGEGAGGHGMSGGKHSTEGQSSPSGHDGGGSDGHSTSGGDHSGSGSGKSGSGSGDSSVNGSSGSGDSGSGRDAGSGAISGSGESSGSDSSSSSGGGSTESTETTSGGSESTSDGISGDSRDSSSGDGLIEEISPLN